MSTYTKCMGKRNKKGVKTPKKLWTKKKKKKKTRQFFLSGLLQTMITGLN